jgi:hypothetical protein
MTMNLPGSEEPSAEELIGALNALGVHFLAGGESGTRSAGLSPARLLAMLAEQGDARLRLAIVPLLLCRPELARAVPEAISLLSEPGLTNLKLFYTAAALLQQEYGSSLHDLTERWEPLPDLFSKELGVPSRGSLETRLRSLGERHRAASGVAANWIGTYRYAAERLIKRLTWEVEWAT